MALTLYRLPTSLSVDPRKLAIMALTAIWYKRLYCTSPKWAHAYKMTILCKLTQWIRQPKLLELILFPLGVVQNCYHSPRAYRVYTMRMGTYIRNIFVRCQICVIFVLIFSMVVLRCHYMCTKYYYIRRLSLSLVYCNGYKPSII